MIPDHRLPTELPAAFATADHSADERRSFVFDPLLGTTDTRVLAKMWGLDTETVLEEIAALVMEWIVSYVAGETSI